MVRRGLKGSNGFTIVELIITITIMGILLILAVVNVNSTQAKARDDERKADVESFAYHLESYFKTGRNAADEVGTYPSTELLDADDPLGNIRDELQDIDFKSLTAPGKSDPLDTLTMATNATQTTAGVAPQPTINQYVYQPLKQDGTLCVDDSDLCTKYNIYYRIEADNTIQMVTSKNQ